MRRTRLARTLIIVLAITVAILSGCRNTAAPVTNSSATAQPTNTRSNEPPSNQIPLTPPFLSGNIANLSIYPVPNNTRNVALTVFISVKNVGSPTVAKNWKLVMASGGEEPRELQPVHVNGVVGIPGGEGQVDLGKEDLALKSKSILLTKGNSLDGVLTFVLADTSEKNLSNNNSSFVVKFEDSQGRLYQTRKYVIGNKR